MGSKKSKNIFVYTLIALILVLFVIGMILAFKKDLKISPYDHTIHMEVNSDLDIAAPSVCYGNLFKCTEITPEIQNNLISTQLGAYTNIYTYKYSNQKTDLEIKIIVEDTTKPVINSSDKIEICPNGKFINKDITVKDNYSEDLDDKVDLIQEDGKYFLTVKDSSNNETKKEVSVTKVDNTKPNLTLKGSNVTLYVGSTYSESGYSATDECDGDLTSKVTVSNNVDTKTPGTYKVTYKVSDTSGNTTSTERTVTIKNRPVITGDKLVYLTFDDGPGPYTLKLLDILKKYDVKATFFVTNQWNNPTYMSYLKNIHDGGHAIGIHSYTHKYSIYQSSETYFNDLNKIKDTILQYTGVETNLLRFPGGSSNTISRNYSKGIMTKLVQEVTNEGYVYFDWNVDSGDAGGARTSAKVYKNVVGALGGGRYVVLMHDIHSYTVDAIEDILKYGLDNGYTFKALDENSPTAHHGILN